MADEKRILRKFLPVLIILAALGIMVLMIVIRPAPKKEVKENPGVLVEIKEVRRESHQIVVSGTGTVHAKRETSIIPQVSGKVTYIAPAFVAGGFFKKGELLFQIEKVDYELNVERARAALAQAELELAREESNAEIARDEWNRLNRDKVSEPNPLVIYEPQLKRAHANVLSAKASLKQSELDLSRTSLHAPFNCRMRSEGIDLGQYIRSGNIVGVIAGTNSAEIVVPLALDKLHWLKVPRGGSRKKGSQAIIKLKSGGKTYEWQGWVTRSLGEVDEKGRMARIVVVVNDPYRLNGERLNGEPDLEVGMFVEVDILGEKISDVVLLRRDAIKENDTVWVMDDESKLKIKTVSVLRRERENVVIQSGLDDGDRVVMTMIQGAADGMKLRPLKGEIRR